MKNRIHPPYHAAAEKHAEEPHDGDILAGLPNDLERYRYCWKQAVHWRNKWFEGQRARVSSALVTTVGRWGSLTEKERIAHAKVDWFTSLEAKDIGATEQYYLRWANSYLDRWNAQLLYRLVAAVETRTPAGIPPLEL